MSKMGTVPGSYVLVTAMKNEGKMLPGLFESVQKQSRRPVLWLIADDGSTDDGYEQAKKFALSNPWVVVVTRREVPNPPWVRYGSAVAFGYGKARETAEENRIDYGFVAVLDADTVVDKDYFEKLLEAFEKDEKAAIASGMIVTEGGGRLESRPAPRGCARMYRKDFLEGIGGFAASPAYETVPEIKAANRGLSFAVVKDARGLHRRRSTQISGAEGLRSRGVVRYCLGMDFVSALAWTYVYARAVGLRQARGFLGGYVEGVWKRYPRIDDEEVVRYFRGSWKRFLTSSDTKVAVVDMTN